MAFTSSRRIDFPMVDMAKIVYYPQFWDLAHRFYEESWEYSCGMHYNEILREHKIGFPLVHSEANWWEATMDDGLRNALEKKWPKSGTD